MQNDGGLTEIWRPAQDAWMTTAMGEFLTASAAKRDLSFSDYEDAWRWSVENLEDFWADVWDHFNVIAHTPYDKVLDTHTMPGAHWFSGATLNYAEHSLRGDQDAVCVRGYSQTTEDRTLTKAELSDLVGRIQIGLRGLGVEVGDRVVGYLPNIPEAVAAYLATAGLGAIFMTVPAEMGARSVLDRVTQLEPTVLITVDGYKWGTKEIERREQVAEVRAGLSAAISVVEISYLGLADEPVDCIKWSDLISTACEPRFEPVPFDHPLVVLFSSGTTGRPKAIVHSHGGILLEHFKSMGLQSDVRPGDTAFWYSTTGWMVWNFVVSCLIVDACVVLMDGDPAYPDLGAQWAVAGDSHATYLGTSAGYLSSCAREKLQLDGQYDLSQLRIVASSGSPLPPQAALWVAEALSGRVQIASVSGGTDICTALVGSSPLKASYAGEMSCRPLGVSTWSFDDDGQPVRGVPGELVVTEPMPSMPVGFWGDEDGSRYRAAYFEDFPGIWRHGDWLIHTERDTFIITGRSDATLNRGGVRLGTAEFYDTLEAMAEVSDSLVLHLEDDVTAHGTLVIVVVPTDGTDGLGAKVRATLRRDLSPRHLPDLVVFADGLPRNINGKKLEVPMKRILQGIEVDQAVDLGGVDRPDHLLEAISRVKAAVAARD